MTKLPLVQVEIQPYEVVDEKTAKTLMQKSGVFTNLGVRKNDIWYLQIVKTYEIPCQRLKLNNKSSITSSDYIYSDLLDLTNDFSWTQFPTPGKIISLNLLLLKSR
jgi:hypothetical protein